MASGVTPLCESMKYFCFIGASHQRPGIRPAIFRRRGERAGGQRASDAAAQRRDFAGIQQSCQRPAGLALTVSQVVFQSLEVRSQVGRERLAREVRVSPSQLVVDVEAQPMVDGDDARVPGVQTMSALAIGVVDDKVEEREGPEHVGKSGGRPGR